MRRKNILSLLVLKFFKLFFRVKENPSKDIGNPKEILIVRQHNQFGDLLASTSMFLAIKEKFPECNITIIVSPQNCNAIGKNVLIKEKFVFNKKKLFNLNYLTKLLKTLRKGYDISIVPVTISISFTSNLLSRLSKAKIRIGPKSLNGKINDSAFFFDRRIDMNWDKNPKRYVADYGLDILRPFGIDIKNYQIVITTDEEDNIESQKFIEEIRFEKGEILIGLHVGAGKIQNRWDTGKFSSLIILLKGKYKVKFYFTGTDADFEQIQDINNKLNFHIPSFLNKNISETASIISKSHLFITNDTGIMHVAGSTDTPQISLFGPTNPEQWSPIGKKKYFLKVSENINSISIEEVFGKCKNILEKEAFEKTRLSY
ncbi:MAG: glycosyltransferase family 9 protein [Ignavibacteriales bacterium]|nr:glycosyltransferase family 9 protein [Ignavibacteriales bacterium]